MAEKLFGNSIASEISFDEALENGILPEFDYICALYDYKESLEKLRATIESSRDVVNSKRTEEALKLFTNLEKLSESNKDDVKQLFKTHLTNKNGKYLIFCKNLEDLNKKIIEFKELFSELNSNIDVYKVSSSEEDLRKNAKVLSAFEKNNSENSLKLMFSVNMLNEGYHLKDIDGIIMMRPTQSPTVYQQQIGRALTVGNKKPVIIDLVNNCEKIKIIEDLTDRIRKYKGRNTDKDEKEYSSIIQRVRVFDYVKDTNEIIEKISKLSRIRGLTFEDKIELFKRFYEDENTDGNIIYDTIYEGYPIGVYLTYMRHEIVTGMGNYTEEQKKILMELRLFR